MQSHLVAGFRTFPLKKRTSNDLPPHVKGAATWQDFEDDAGYFILDVLSGTYLPMEYKEDSCQWYFIRQDSRSRKWNAINTVPQSYNLGRQSIHTSHITAAADIAPEDIRIGTYSEPDQDHQHSMWQQLVDKTVLFNTEKTSNIPSSTTTSNIDRLAMSQTTAALTLAGTATTGSHFDTGFSWKGKEPALPPYVPGGRGGPSGSRPPGGLPGGGAPGGGGGGLPGGGGVFPLPGPSAAAGGGGGKLGGNPPRIFDGTFSEADAFMNEFSLYHLTNIGADQIDNPMKRAALLLGFIQGENVKDWVKCRTNWAIDQINTGRPPTDEYYWTTIAQAFESAFQDTGATERAEEKLRHLAFTSGEINGFIAKFKSLANEAGYLLNNRSTITLFASKLPFRMMEHLYKVVRPCNFAGWANAARQYHQDNQAVLNIRDIHGDTPRKPPQKTTAGFTVAELAKILKVKMLSLDPDAMDTQADRNRSGNRNRTRGRASATAPKDVEEQRKTGRCFTCNKQGHISRNCPDKPTDNKPTTLKKNTKAHQAAIMDDETSDEDEIDYGSPEANAWVRKGQVLPVSKKEDIVRMAWEAETGMLVGPDVDF